MAVGPDDSEPGDEELSPKAKEIKKQIRDGRYQVDLEQLADNLLNEGVLDEELEEKPVADPAQNDQKPEPT